MSGIAAPTTQHEAIKEYVIALNAISGSYNRTAEDIADVTAIESTLLTMIRRNGYTVFYKPGKGFQAKKN